MSKSIAEIEVAVEELSKLKLDGKDVTIVLGATPKDDGPSVLRRIAISKKVSEDFRGIGKDVLLDLSKLVDTKDLVIHKHTSMARLESHEIEWVEVEKVDSATDLISALSNVDSISILDDKNGDEEFLRTLKFYVIVISGGAAKSVLMFRSFSPQRELGRSLKYAVMFKNGHYDRLDERTFLFDSKIDCIAVAGQIFVIQKGNFQKIFRYFEMLKKIAKATLKKIENLIPILNFEEFSNACEVHQYKMMKLKNIADSLDAKNVSMANLKKVIETYKLKIKVVDEKGQEKLCFDGNDRWAILKLLDDAYLTSDLTGTQYEVGAKREL